MIFGDVINKIANLLTIYSFFSNHV